MCPNLIGLDCFVSEVLQTGSLGRDTTEGDAYRTALATREIQQLADIALRR